MPDDIRLKPRASATSSRNSTQIDQDFPPCTPPGTVFAGNSGAITEANFPRLVVERGYDGRTVTETVAEARKKMSTDVRDNNQIDSYIRQLHKKFTFDVFKCFESESITNKFLKRRKPDYVIVTPGERLNEPPVLKLVKNGLVNYFQLHRNGEFYSVPEPAMRPMQARITLTPNATVAIRYPAWTYSDRIQRQPTNGRKGDTVAQ